jgi:hypothetical protein
MASTRGSRGRLCRSAGGGVGFRCAGLTLPADVQALEISGQRFQSPAHEASGSGGSRTTVRAREG